LQAAAIGVGVSYPLLGLIKRIPMSLILVGAGFWLAQQNRQGSVETELTKRARGMVAEGVGFEPTLRFPVNTLSKRAPSATRPPLLIDPREGHVLLHQSAHCALLRTRHPHIFFPGGKIDSANPQMASCGKSATGPQEAGTIATVRPHTTCLADRKSISLNKHIYVLITFIDRSRTTCANKEENFDKQGRPAGRGFTAIFRPARPAPQEPQ
jgi:hypothetical protein